MVELAGNPDRLAAVRAGLQLQMTASRLCDGRLHAPSFSQLLRNVWRDYCA
jgi:predicted O-linked N-acetylglucosamine transferase (SPINDLY family)